MSIDPTRSQSPKHSGAHSSQSSHRPVDVLILGGGVIGMATAWELSQQGLSVRVLERTTPGAQASRAGAGMLAPTFELDLPKPLLAALIESRDLWPSWLQRLTEESGVVVAYDRSGSIVAALDGNEVTEVEALVRHARRLGEPATELSLVSARAEVPDLNPRTLVAAHLGGEHRVDNRQCCQALQVLLERSGVQWTCTEVTSVELSQSSATVMSSSGDRYCAAKLIVTAGAWSGAIKGLPDLPVRPIRGQMIRLEDIDWPWQGIVRGPSDYAVRRGGGLLVGATLEDVGFDPRTDVGGLADLTQATLRLLPGLRGKPVTEHWAGLRPASADELPLLGQWGKSPLIYATGHYRNGILLAPWTAQRMTQLVTGSSEETFSPAFQPERLLSTNDLALGNR